MLDDKVGYSKTEVVGNQTGMYGGDNADGEEDSVRGIEKIAGEEEKKTETGYNKEKPPVDDCCPICYGEFKIPCKANCGHWFCGSCILQLWEYRSRPRRCKCPFCSSAISRLTPEVSAGNKIEDGDAVLENIEKYNRFYVKGMKGFFLMLAFYFQTHVPLLHVYIWNLLRVLLLVFLNAPAFVKRVFVDLIRHPERIDVNFPRVRLITCTLWLLLHLYQFILPPGQQRLQIAKIRVYIDCASIILVVLPYLVMLCKIQIHIWWLRFQIWRLRRELEARNAAFHEAAALPAQSDALGRHEASLGENAILLQDNDVLQAAVEVAQQEQDDRAFPRPEDPLRAGADATSQVVADVDLRMQDMATG